MKKLLAFAMTLALALSGIWSGYAIAEDNGYLALLRCATYYVDSFNEVFLKSLEDSFKSEQDDQQFQELMEYVKLDTTNISEDNQLAIYKSPCDIYELQATLDDDDVFRDELCYSEKYELVVNLIGFYNPAEINASYVIRLYIVGSFLNTCLWANRVTDSENTMSVSSWWMYREPTDDYIGTDFTIHYELDENGLSHFVFNFES